MHNNKIFVRNLTSWYLKNARDLPWRRTNDPYQIWISEIMLQQTPVNKVIPYYLKWIQMFPSVETLAHAQLRSILKAWQGLGYYQRAKNIKKTAALLIRNFNGRFPSQINELLKMPGLGPYTAAAILSLAFNRKYPLIDANVRRVFMRILGIQGLADKRHDKTIFLILNKLIVISEPKIFNQAIMELGALICRSYNPLCLSCPVLYDCQAYRKGIQEIIPVRIKKKMQNINVVVGIIKRDNTYFIQKRPSSVILGDLWEFPGGKVKKQETMENALKRELREELKVEVISARKFINVKHFYTRYKVNLTAFFCKLKFYPAHDQHHKWVTLPRLYTFPFPSGTAKIVEALSGLKS